ncbi:MAG: IgGFc-binding protein, partial [Sphingobacteriaceae bacterium]
MISQKSTLLLVLILLIGSLNQLGFSQSTSNRGTDFWVAYAGHIDNEGSRLTLFISSETNAFVNINAGGVQLSPISLQPNQAQSVVLNPSTYTNIYIGSNNVVESNKGIHITSDNPIIVYSHISRSARSAASLIIPTKALGNEYYSINYKQVTSTASNPNRYSQFTLVGVEDDTQIEILPTQNSIVGTSNPPLASVPFQIELDKGDVYQYQSTTDLSGSLIRTLNGCKPLAVFSGSTFTAFCEDNSSVNGGSGDNLYQQLIPVSAWGKNFVSAPFYNTEHGATDIYRIIVSKDNTTIKVNNSLTDANGTPLTNPYSKGDIITFFSKTANVIQANNPISLTQFQTTQSCNLSNTGNNNTALYPGDPEMTILSPIEQTLTDVTVYSGISTTAAPTAITKHYINIIIKTADAPQLKIDGTTFPPSSFTQINSEYSYLIHDVTASSAANPTHRITAEGGFVAIAYGYGIVESYAYLAGADLKNLNQFVQLENPVNQQAITNACVNQEYKIGVVLPYITNTLSWDLGNGVLMNYTNPVYTAITSNGVTAYKYEYPESTGAIYATPGKKVISITA